MWILRTFCSIKEFYSWLSDLKICSIVNKNPRHLTVAIVIFFWMKLFIMLMHGALQLEMRSLPREALLVRRTCRSPEPGTCARAAGSRPPSSVPGAALCSEAGVSLDPTSNYNCNLDYFRKYFCHLCIIMMLKKTNNQRNKSSVTGLTNMAFLCWGKEYWN